MPLDLRSMSDPGIVPLDIINDGIVNTALFMYDFKYLH